jgi:hypothetical protein
MNDALKQAQQCLAIHSVNLRESRVEVHSEVEPWAYDRSRARPQSFRQVNRVQEVEIQIENESERSWEYRFHYALGVRLINLEANHGEEGDQPTADMEIVAIFQARYLCRRRLEQEEVSAFAQDNVGYHVWPYWREFVQTSCNRIGLASPIEIPMYWLTRP